MTRAIAAVLGGLLVAGAGARGPLPLPPPLPEDPPIDQAAPVPDADLSTPGQVAQDQAAFALRTYPMQDFGTSDGFIPGSAYQSPEQRKLMQTPGFMVTVPLQ